MKCVLGSWLLLPLLLGGLVLGGCLPPDERRIEEEKEPHFLAGKSRVNAMDYQGAIGSFEKAIEVNPHSAAAHFELGILYDQKEGDPAAAIYHYDRYLRYRPGAQNADMVKQLIMACKQELARTVSLGPVTEKQQRDLEKLAEDNKRMFAENKRLADEVAALRAQLASIPTNPPAASRSRDHGGAGQSAGARTNSAGQVQPAARTHVVRPGDTPAGIARQYNVKLEALTAANPGLDPKRLRPGKVLRIP